VRAVVFRNPRRARGLISLAGPRSRPLQGWSRGGGGESYREEGPGGRERGGPRDRLRTRYAAWRKNAAEPAGLLRVAPRYAARGASVFFLSFEQERSSSSRISSRRKSGRSR